MSNHKQLKRETNPILKHWHGIVQILTAVSTLVLFGFLVRIVFDGDLQICDAILFGEILLTFAIAVIHSHSYNYEPEPDPPNLLREKAEKLKATWLHANFCWQTINVWMTITPLYCTCTTIYLSGTSEGAELDQLRILVYSIISLVLSLGIYVIRPSNRGAGYRKAYLGVTKVLTKTYNLAGSVLPDNVREELENAIFEGEKNIAKQDLLDP